MRIGDVFIKGGSSGHAMIIADMAVNQENKKICLLAQSYMPVRDIHIMKNPIGARLSPWYELSNETIFTPEWIFEKNQLRTWYFVKPISENTIR